MNRKDYLSHNWKPYPEMPPRFLAAGRVSEIVKKGDLFAITLLRNHQPKTIEFEKAPPESEFLIVGDLIAVVSLTEIILLAPHNQPLPQRVFNPSLLEKWGSYLQFLRTFFKDSGFVEVRTPLLVPCPGTEPSLDVFSTSLKIGSYEKRLFLPTSPELHLKKALALGAEKVFEISTSFRNAEVTERHQPEFLMLEWYRAYDNLSTIKKDVEQLVASLAHSAGVPGPQKVRTVTVAELFKTYCEFDLTPKTSLQELKALAESLGVDVHSAESIDDFFFLIFLEKIESQLPHEDLIFVEKYPPYQAALARLTEDGWGDRFEVYWKGLELANAFNELNDPVIQRKRSAEDLQKKKEMQKEVIDLDEEFFQSLEAGMPPSGGIALGVERLFMALYDVKELKSLRLFPI